MKGLRLLVLEGNPIPEEELVRIRAALPACEVKF
jgi:hypothetical protein